jgi:co-chaperonin GroES (HSP10)
MVETGEFFDDVDLDNPDYDKINQKTDGGEDVMDMDIKKMDGDTIRTLQPTSDRVLVRLYEPDWTTGGGIIIPNQGRTQPLVGKILEVGPGLWDNDKKERSSPNLYPGQYVLTSNVSYDKEDVYVDEDDIKYILIRQHKINGVFASSEYAFFGWYNEPSEQTEG